MSMSGQVAALDNCRRTRVRWSRSPEVSKEKATSLHNAQSQSAVQISQKSSRGSVSSEDLGKAKKDFTICLERIDLQEGNSR